MIWQIQILCILLLQVCAVPRDRVENVLKKNREIVWSELTNSEWVYPTYLGTMFLSEYWFEIKALQLESKFDEARFTKLLLERQRSDGSWDQVHDAYLQTGQLDATIFNYWYLKSVGVHSQQAQDWILAHGGIEKAQTMTKFKLAIFGQYDWEKLFNIPLFVFYDRFNPVYIKDITAQWVYPHMTALAYLQHIRKTIHIGADILELYTEPVTSIPQYTTVRTSPALKNLITEILALKQPHGSFGGYTISTLLGMMALDDFKQRSTEFRIEIDEAIRDGSYFCEWNYFNDRVPYEGSLDDGRWWDTILVTWSQLESGEDPEKLRPIVDNMIKKGVQANGGIEYGLDFGYAPDADDTGLLLAILSHYKYDTTKSVQFLNQIQNKDGGFPAFDKGKMGKNPLWEFAFNYAGISDSAEIFDPSSPDVTAHIIEGLQSINALDQKLLKKAIQYFKDTQTKFGAWEGRWGINYIYGVGAVLPALKAVKHNLTEHWIHRAVYWLISKQNKDGGFGETTLSYNDVKKYNGVGVSTVTQTSWALLALLAVREDYRVGPYIEKAVLFLVSEFESRGEFFDVSVVGTGHRGLLYLQYPSYARSFPVLALSRYLKN